MPQIEQLAATYTSQIFWLLVTFGLVFLIVGRGMVPKVMETVATRDRQIADDLAAAQAARDAADEQELAWRARENAHRAQAQALIAQAKAGAAGETEAALATAQSRIDARLAEAEQRIKEARNSAAAEIESVALEATQDIVRRLAGVEVERAAAQTAVREVMAHG